MSYKSHHCINVGAKAPYCTNVETATCIPIKTKQNNCPIMRKANTFYLLLEPIFIKCVL